MTAKACIKVKITLSLDVDPVAWDDNYGTGTSPSSVRDDVKTYMENLCREQLKQIGCAAQESA